MTRTKTSLVSKRFSVVDADQTSRRAAAGGRCRRARRAATSNWTLEVVLGRLRGVHNTPLLVETFVAADDKNSSVLRRTSSRRQSDVIVADTSPK